MCVLPLKSTLLTVLTPLCVSPSFTNPNGILPRTIASAHPIINTFRDTLRRAQGILHN